MDLETKINDTPESIKQDPATIVALEVQNLYQANPENEQAINQALGHIRSLTYNMLRSGLASRRVAYHDAQEVLQTTYTKVYKALEEGRFEARSKIGSYAYSAMLNNLGHLMDKKHNLSKWEELVLDVPEVIADQRDQPDVVALSPTLADDEMDPRAAAILNTIEKVSPRDKQIFYWAKVEGYSHQEIARKLAAGALGGVAIYMTIEAIKVAVSRTRQKAREQLS